MVSAKAADQKNQYSSEWVSGKVLGVYVHPTRNTPIVFIGDDAERTVIPIWIGFLEAQAILFAWKQLAAPRPLTIDLLAGLVQKDLHAGMERAVIHAIKDGTYFAYVEIKDKEGNIIKRDARPSDAIAFALKASAPIIVSDQVVQASTDEVKNAKALLDFLRLESEDNADLQAELSPESTES